MGATHAKRGLLVPTVVLLTRFYRNTNFCLKSWCSYLYTRTFYRGPGSLLNDPEIEKRCIVGHCLDECKEYTRELMGHPCLTPEMRFIFQSDIRTKSDNYTLKRMEAWYRLDSCSAEIAVEEKCKDGGGWWPPVIGGTQRLSVGAAVAVIPMLVALFL